MNTDRHRFRKASRKLFFSFVSVCSFYVVSYSLNSFFGGYWMKPEMDGRDRYSFGLSMPTAIMWQPLFGHEAIGHWDYLGAFYTPLIRLDRKFIHRTIYISDDDGFEEAAHLSVSKVHPSWRDEFVTKVTVFATRDGAGQAIRCTLHYTGSDYPRAISEVWIPRELAKALEVSSPVGFTEKDFENYPKYHREHYIRWVGKLILPKDQDMTLAIPAKEPQAGKGHIRFYYERLDAASNNYRNFCSVELR